MALHGATPKPSPSEPDKTHRAVAAVADRDPKRRFGAVHRDATDVVALERDDSRLRKDDSRQPSSKRMSRHSVPNSSVMLWALDFIFIGTAQAAIFGFIHERLEFGGEFQVPLVVGISVITNVAFLYAFGSYLRETLVNRDMAAARLPVALGFAGAALFFALHFVLSAIYPDDRVYLSISRCATISLVGTGISLCMAVMSRVVFYAMARHQWFRRRILVLGTGQRAHFLRNLMNHDAHRLVNDLYFVPEATIGAESKKPHAELADHIVAPEGRSIDDLAHALMADEVVIAVDDRRGMSLERLLNCKTSGIPVTDYQTFVERETGHIDLSWLELSWLVYSDGFRMRPIDVILKRFLDISVSSLLLIVTFPVLVGAVIAISSEGHKRVFFKQERVTQDGRRFWLYKLRTMLPDAEKNGPQWASENDPRVTRVGALLRRTRIDEIPQLVNVLWGDMSLVGPRPERPVFVMELSQKIRMYDLRHTVKAGLTGWAQVNYPYGASLTDAERKLEYDLYYIKNYSLLRDVTIILQTLRVVFWPNGVR